MSIWWQFIPYFLVGVSEVFTNIGTMELFYTQGVCMCVCVCVCVCGGGGGCHDS